MSTTAEDVREQLSRLLRELQALAVGGLTAEEFYPKFLKRVVHATGAPIGVVWGYEAGRFVVRAAIGLDLTNLRTDTDANGHNQRLLAETAATGEVRIVEADRTEVQQHGLVPMMAPFVVDETSSGVLQLYHRADHDPAARSRYVQFLEMVAGIASKFAKNSEPDAPITVEAAESTLGHFSLDVHRTLDVNQVTSTIANDGRVLVGCDRLSVVLVRGRANVCQAISGQERVNRRANVVRLGERLARSVIAARENLWYDGAGMSLPPQVEKPLAAFLEESGTRSLGIVPLYEPEPPPRPKHQADETARTKREPRVIGCLVAEWIGDGAGTQVSRVNLERLAEYSSAAAANALVHDGILLRPVRRALGRGLEWFRGRKLWATLAGLLLFAGLVTALLLVPWQYRIEGSGRLMPVARSDVFAPEDATVRKVLVTGGQEVFVGTPLLRLHSEELDERRTNLLADQRELRSSVNLLARRIAVSVDDDPETAARLEAEREDALVKLDSLDDKLAKLDARIAALVVTSPIAGIVTTFQLEQRLDNRPVRFGESLVEIMDPASEWRLELEVDERRLGHLARARTASDEPLDVEFALATMPEKSFHGDLETLATRVRPNQEGGSVLEVFVDLDETNLPARRIGSEVRARVDCGQRSLGFVLFGDVVEFIRRRWWW